jgi:hypothetical protein
VDATVLLVARMSDGTVENVAMGALAEPGIVPRNGADDSFDARRSWSPRDYGRQIHGRPVEPIKDEKN